MITDPHANAAQGRRWALWLFLFVGVVLHAGVCPPNAHAGVLGATASACAAPAAGAPPSGRAAQVGGALPSGRESRAAGTPPLEREAQAGGAPPSGRAAPSRASGRVGEAGRRCVPAPPHPHRHAPCVDMNHRGFSPERSTWSWPAGALPRCPLHAATSSPGVPGVCRWGCSLRPAAPRSGADLLIDLCSSRT